MTPQEAIDYLLDPIGKREQHDEAVRMAIDALMLQIPKKPIKSVDPFNENLYKQCCPTCGTYIAYGNSRVGTKHLLTMSQNMCGYCGQKILWRDEDDNKRDN